MHVGSFSSAIQNDHTNYPPTKILCTHVRQQALLNVCVYLTDLYNHLSYKVLTISVGPGTENGLNLFTDCNSLFPWKQTTETHIIPPQHRCLWNKACELVQAVISRLLLLSYNIILCYISKQEDQTSKTTEWKSESLGVGKRFRYCSLQHHVPVRRHKYRNRSSTQTSHVVDGASASQMTSLFSTLTPNAWWNTSSVLSIISQSWSETIFSYFNMNNIFWDTDFNTKGTLLV